MGQLGALLETTRLKKPVVHFITNYVTVNDCANITLAAGGTPLMADDMREVEEMVALCSALVLNIGTPNRRVVDSMLEAGRCANRLGRPLILDPVGAGASTLRNETVVTLLEELRFSIIKGNISEIMFTVGGIAATSGVDANFEDLITEDTLESGMAFAGKLSRETGSVVVITGPVDIVADQKKGWIIRNGHPLMSRITGSGCMLAGVMGCLAGANPDMPLDAAVAAVSAMGVCGELAHEGMVRQHAGLGTYRTLLMDSMSLLDGETLERRMRIEPCDGW